MEQTQDKNAIFKDIQVKLFSNSHIPVLDGLRGFAVLYVILDHLFPYHQFAKAGAEIQIFLKAFFSMGWSGVDLFFVLSGFLITGILINSYNDKNYFLKFYIRRTLRIFPLYYLMLFLFLIIVPRIDYFARWNFFWLSEGYTTRWYWLYLYNFLYEVTNQHSFLVVVWSLCIEEQYYLVFPSIIYLLRNKNNKILIFLLLLVMFSFLLRLILYHLKVVSVYHFTFTHLDGIALGGALRVFLHKVDLSSRYYLYIFKYLKSALLIIFVLVLFLSFYCALTPNKSHTHITYHPMMIQIGYFLIPIFFTLLLLNCIVENNTLTQIFNGYFLRQTGKYSYAMYLLHFPSAWLLATILSELSFHISIDFNSFSQMLYGIPYFLCIVGLTYFIAYLSWVCFENPINNLKNRLI